MQMKSFGLAETKLFHFHRIFKNGGGGEGREFKRTPELHLYPPLYLKCLRVSHYYVTIIDPMGYYIFVLISFSCSFSMHYDMVVIFIIIKPEMSLDWFNLNYNKKKKSKI